jgi:hypothetical protein
VRSQPGDQNGRARLTVAAVEAARLAYWGGGKTSIGRLARKYGVARSTMADALAGRTWREAWMPARD